MNCVLRILVLLAVGLGLGACSDSVEEPRTNFQDSTFPDQVMGCSAYAIQATDSQAALEVKAEFGVPPYTVTGVSYDTNPSGEEELSFEDAQFAFNSTNQIAIDGIVSGTESVFGDIEISDATGKTASCSFDLDVSAGGGGVGGAMQENCQILFSHNPTLTHHVVYLTVIPTDRYGWYWLRNVTSTAGFVYGGSPDGVTGYIGFTAGGVYTIQAEIEDPATGETGVCTGTQYVYYF